MNRGIVLGGAVVISGLALGALFWVSAESAQTLARVSERSAMLQDGQREISTKLDEIHADLDDILAALYRVDVKVAEPE